MLSFLAAGVFLPRNFSSKEKIIFQIEKGQSLRVIARNLEKDGIVWGGPLFSVYALFLGEAGQLQTGCYFLSPSMNVPEIVEILSSGSIAKEKITIPEGFTSGQIFQKLQTLNLAGSNLAKLAEYEGYLFPDTYEITYCQEQEKIIETMTANFSRKTASLKITPRIVVMASLLEKELKTKEDKELAAGILWKRLREGMPLQVDAYMWTYEHYGLPPKPISNPGIGSIEAALYPKGSAYWYYLSSPDGKTIFSKTLEEHNIAKAKYLK